MRQPNSDSTVCLARRLVGMLLTLMISVQDADHHVHMSEPACSASGLQQCMASTRPKKDAMFMSWTHACMQDISAGCVLTTEARLVYAGKGTDKIFPALAASAANTATFVASAVDFATKHGLDGVDLDWEVSIGTLHATLQAAGTGALAGPPNRWLAWRGQ